ncbi:glycoside hydrolase family 3 protein [Glacieibacterium frigidum]|uniref:Glycoside hydrolase family 3 protein n=1 Tax=Glacieibacterium frigidum TaxID=2593303 RepID=A0A552UJE3_9SPHN|nr:exo 1,3/1,4-beta-D-glucan glucohydrolase [Glacieibacterium frigidum]TRW18357.1 glycoside hydrolase family 3 protein [Glacieibacterium frigidum]
MIAASLAGVSLPAVAAAQPALSPVANPALWPKVAARPVRDAKVEAQIDALLAKMSIEDKVGQLLQVDIGSLTPADLLTYKLGSVLNGGNSDPNSDPLAPPAEWLKLADKFYDASMTRSDGRPQIPVIWGTDAVHGNNNIFGATLFPHNIGLGAARDPALVREIARVTALETAAAGLDWTFAPTLAVVQDDRWGRTYESYSEEPALFADYATATIEGLQGKVGTPEFLSSSHVLATTKHFLGDGGTGGRDQGDTRLPEADFRDIHLGGYPAAIAAGTQSVMASFSSWNGVKMSGNKSLLTDVLKVRMGFDGFVVGDWNSHGQVPGCTNEDCAAAINAGMDMFMYSGPDWKKLYANTLTQAMAGTIPQARLDDAVRRILRAKIRAGLFEKGRPSSRPLAGKFELINAPAHREIARAAVRASLVLLKNERGTLPLRPNAEILVAGGGADKINQQAGGWSLSWQGDDMPNSAFPNAHSIWTGIRDTVAAAGGRATLTPDGSFTKTPAAAIVVFGEQPYAEFKGDRATLDYSAGDKSDLALLRKLKAAGIPVVAVFLSGRPLWVNAEINASDAFVAAFLPGSEGAAIADVLFRKPDGGIAHDFRGKLSFSWPRRPDQYLLNRRDKPYDPLFAYGYGLSYAKPGTVPTLDETRPAGLASDTGGILFAKGAVPEGWNFAVVEPGGPVAVLTGAVGQSTGGKLVVTAVDRASQEDSRRLTWTGPAELRLTPPAPVDLTRETNGEISLTVEFRVDTAPVGPVTVAMADTAGKVATIALPATLAASKPGEWTTLSIPLQCFAKQGIDMAQVASPLVIASSAGALSVSAVRQVYVNVPMTACAR